VESSSFADDGSPEVTITSGAQFFSESERSYFRKKTVYFVASTYPPLDYLFKLKESRQFKLWLEG